jgi:hypothetical protein
VLVCCPQNLCVYFERAGSPVSALTQMAPVDLIPEDFGGRGVVVLNLHIGLLQDDRPHVFHWYSSVVRCRIYQDNLGKVDELGDA